MLYQPVLFDAHTEDYLEKIESTPSTEALVLLKTLQSAGLTETQIYTLLALASARFIDHHGPWIGHGTLNMAPLIHASEVLGDDERSRQLLLLQATCYVLNLFQHPNYGPYLMPTVKGEQGASVNETLDDFMETVVIDDKPLYAENLFVGLYRQTGGDVRSALLQVGLQAYPENEHRLLIVHRTFDLLAMDDNTRFGEPLLRPAVQYNAAAKTDLTMWKHVQHLISDYGLDPQTVIWHGDVDVDKATQLAHALLDAESGIEPEMLAQQLARKTNLPTVLEAVSLASSMMLLHYVVRGQHVVTGFHCIFDIVRDETVPAELRLSALLLSFSSARTRAVKENRKDWADIPALSAAATTEDTFKALSDIAALCLRDETGMEAAAQAGQFLVNTDDADLLAQMLLRLGAETNHPFGAIHTGKMVWGHWVETKKSTHSLRWVHLASSAACIANQVQEGLADEKTQNVLKQFYAKA